SVTPAAASALLVSAPASATSGAPSTVTVTARDAFGNTASGYSGTVHFASSDSQAVLPADSALSHRTGTFSAPLKTAGSATLTATDTATGSLSGSPTVSVNSAVSGALVFHTDTPQTIAPPRNLVFSAISVPQNVTIASVKVQANITYPRDSDLRLVLVYYD